MARTWHFQDMAFLAFLCMLGSTSALQQPELILNIQLAQFLGLGAHVRDVQRRLLLTVSFDMQTLKSTQAMADAMKGATKVCQPSKN